MNIDRLIDKLNQIDDEISSKDFRIGDTIAKKDFDYWNKNLENLQNMLKHEYLYWKKKKKLPEKYSDPF